MLEEAKNPTEQIRLKFLSENYPGHVSNGKAQANIGAAKQKLEFNENTKGTISFTNLGERNESREFSRK